MMVPREALVFTQSAYPNGAARFDEVRFEVAGDHVRQTVRIRYCFSS